jgi:hypothetical protein
MKIMGSGPTAGPGQQCKVSGRGGDSSNPSFAEQVSARPATSSSIPPTTPPLAFDGVLAVQEEPDRPGSAAGPPAGATAYWTSCTSCRSAWSKAECPRARCGAWPGWSTGCTHVHRSGSQCRARRDRAQGCRRSGQVEPRTGVSAGTRVVTGQGRQRRRAARSGGWDRRAKRAAVLCSHLGLAPAPLCRIVGGDGNR